MTFDELGFFDDSFESANCGIEALEMTDLEQHVFSLRGCDELAGFTDVCGEGFLHQHVDARIDEIPRDLIMQPGRHRYADARHPAEQTSIIRKCRGAERRANFGDA